MFQGFTEIMTIFAFIVTMIMIFFPPKEMNEAIPASIGAVLVIISAVSLWGIY